MEALFNFLQKVLLSIVGVKREAKEAATLLPKCDESPVVERVDPTQRHPNVSLNQSQSITFTS